MNELMTTNKSLISTDPAIAAAAEGAKARIQSAYLMALHRPRNPDQARDRILHACKRPAFAERVEYNKPVGGRTIKGPSVRFAELALKEWGNVLNDSQVVYEDDQVRRVKIFCTDLETNLTHSKEIVINKTVERKKPTEDREVIGERINSQGQKVYIVRATDDEIQNKEAALISKALRNEGLRLIPTDIIDEGVEVARATLRDRDAKDPDTAKKKILDSFSEIGVLPKDIERYLGHKTDTLTPSELQDLRGIYRAIKDGEARWMDYVEGDKDRGDQPPDTSVFTELISTIKIDENDHQMLEKFIELNAKTHRMTVDHMKMEAAKDFQNFWQSFLGWLKKQRATVESKSQEEKQAEGVGEPPPLSVGDKKLKQKTTQSIKLPPSTLFEAKKAEFVTCPQDGSKQGKEDCDSKCSVRRGCPEWE